MSTPLVQSGAFGPFILRGAHTRIRPRSTERTTEHRRMYNLVTVASGLARVTSEDAVERVLAPAAFLLAPGTPLSVDVDAGSEWGELVFQVLHAERYQRTEHSRPHGPWIDPHPSQPLPQAVFGCDLPPQVPTPLVAGAIAAVHAAVPIYFKGPLLHARANLLLGGWLLDYAEFQASTGRADPGDPVAVAEAWARDHLDARCTVADMARAAKLSLARFKQVYARERTQTPGAFLDGLKVEAACRELRAGLDIRRCARRCGFRSPTAFSAFFRRQLGMPPSQWRRQHRTG